MRDGKGVREEWQRWREGERQMGREGRGDRMGGTDRVKIGHYGSACDSSGLNM